LEYLPEILNATSQHNCATDKFERIGRYTLISLLNGTKSCKVCKDSLPSNLGPVALCRHGRAVGLDYERSCMRGRNRERLIITWLLGLNRSNGNSGAA
jgi:hypothetical protein